MNIPKHCDVVVIGGGPAGSLAGTFLSQQGYEVVLLEKLKHPRDHVGESLTPHFWKYCDIAKVTEKIQAEGFLPKTGGTVVWNGSIAQIAFKDFGYSRPGMHVERDRFDHILLEHAREQGVQVFEEVAVLAAKLNPDGPGSVTYRAAGETATGQVSPRFIIDASGQGAVIAKQEGMRLIDEGFRFMSMWGYFKGSKYVAADGKAHPYEDLSTVPPTTFVSSVEGWGWVWHIPLRESTSVGLVIPQEQLSSVKEADEGLEQYFLRKCAEIPYLNRLLEDADYCDGSFHMVRDYSYLPAQTAGPGFFLIGDAAAFVDPIFSIGIALGMYSAHTASWAIDQSFKDPAGTERYQALFSSAFEKRLELSRALALPRYGVGQDSSDPIKTSMEFENNSEKELMYAASVNINRNENFLEIVRSQEGGIVTSDKFRRLDEIAF